MHRYISALIAFVSLPFSAAAVTPAQTLSAATETLEEFASPRHGNGRSSLAAAYGVAVFPRVTKPALAFGGRGGTGVIFVKGRDGVWSEPVFAEIAGVDADCTGAVLLFTSPRGLERLYASKGKFTLGVDAPAGPADAEIQTYARSDGRFVGTALGKAVIRPDAEANAAYSRGGRHGVRPETVKWDHTPASATDSFIAAPRQSAQTGAQASRPTNVPASPMAPPGVSVPSASPAIIVMPQIVAPAQPVGTAARPPADKGRLEVLIGGAVVAAVGMMYQWAKKKVLRRAGVA